MASNEQDRQLEIAAELEAIARTLAHSTRTVPRSAESYQMLGELRATVDHLRQVCQQLANWHSSAVDGVHYDGQEPGTEGTHRTIVAADNLREAAESLRLTSGALNAAHSGNSVIRWYEEAQQNMSDQPT